MYLKFSSTATATELMKSEDSILEVVSKGASLEIGVNIWEDFYVSQLEMMADPNIPQIFITNLFGTIPCSMFWLEGEIQVDLDKSSIDLMKTKPATQALNWSPSSTMVSDEEFLQDLIPSFYELKEKQIMKSLQTPE